MKTAETEFADFVKEVNNETIDQLKTRIFLLQQGLEQSEAHKEANDDLKAARANVSELSAPYRGVKTAVKLKTKYILEILEKKA